MHKNQTWTLELNDDAIIDLSWVIVRRFLGDAADDDTMNDIADVVQDILRRPLRTIWCGDEAVVDRLTAAWQIVDAFFNCDDVFEADAWLVLEYAMEKVLADLEKLGYTSTPLARGWRD